MLRKSLAGLNVVVNESLKDPKPSSILNKNLSASSFHRISTTDSDQKSQRSKCVKESTNTALTIENEEVE